jgi:hypothetical protein
MMTLNYRIEKDNLLDALNDIEAFEEKMEEFMVKHPAYNYVLDVQEPTSEEVKWVVELKIDKDEQTNTKELT